MMTNKQRIIGKLTSGRFICTVVVVAVYAICAFKGVIEPESVREITLIVLYAYFTRNGINGKNNNHDNDD